MTPLQNLLTSVAVIMGYGAITTVMLATCDELDKLPSGDRETRKILCGAWPITLVAASVWVVYRLIYTATSNLVRAILWVGKNALSPNRSNNSPRTF